MKFIPLFLIISAFCFAQKFTFVYDAKYNLNIQKKDNIINNKMILDYDSNRSIFRESDGKMADSLKLNFGEKMSKPGIENKFHIKKNLSQNNIEKIITYLGVDYLLPIDEKLNWKISSEQKNIGKYKAQKAEVKYGGRDWIAWFTTELPLNDGPYVFHGLPGLIISIQDTNADYSFDLIEVKKGGDMFDTKTNTIKIDWKKYVTLAKSYFNDPYNFKMRTTTDVEKNNKMTKAKQELILENNNPIELNHKIKY